MPQPVVPNWSGRPTEDSPLVMPLPHRKNMVVGDDGWVTCVLCNITPDGWVKCTLCNAQAGDVGMMQQRARGPAMGSARSGLGRPRSTPFETAQTVNGTPFETAQT